MIRYKLSILPLAVSNIFNQIKTLSTTPHNVFLVLYAGEEVVLKEFSVKDDNSKKMLETQVCIT